MDCHDIRSPVLFRANSARCRCWMQELLGINQGVASSLVKWHRSILLRLKLLFMLHSTPTASTDAAAIRWAGWTAQVRYVCDRLLAYLMREEFVVFIGHAVSF